MKYVVVSTNFRSSMMSSGTNLVLSFKVLSLISVSLMMSRHFSIGVLVNTGCPRMFYTVFQKNIKNIKSIMSLIIILVIECLICALPTVKILFTYLYPLRYDRVSLKIDELPKCHFSANCQFLKPLHKQTGALNSSFSQKKSTLAEQYLAWTTVFLLKRV